LKRLSWRVGVAVAALSTLRCNTASSPSQVGGGPVPDAGFDSTSMGDATTPDGATSDATMKVDAGLGVGVADVPNTP